MKCVYPFGERVLLLRSSDESPDQGTSRNVFSACIGICQNGLLKWVSVFVNEEKHSWEALVNVASRHRILRESLNYLLQWAQAYLSGGFLCNFSEITSVQNLNEHIRVKNSVLFCLLDVPEDSNCFQNLLVSNLWIFAWIPKNDRYSYCKGINCIHVMTIVVRALFWINSWLVICEEHPMRSSCVGIVVRSRSCHELNILFSESICIKFLILRAFHWASDQSCQLGFESVLASFQSYMVMNLLVSCPEVLLAMIDDWSENVALERASASGASVWFVHDWTLEEFFRLSVPCNLPIIPLKEV